MKTGKHSLLNLIHGNIRCLYEQAKSDWSFDEIKDLMKMMAIENGWPSKSFKRKQIYKVSRSISGQPDETLRILQITIQVFADENSFWLVQYNEQEKPYRTIGGRTWQEMQEYIEELKNKGLVALAIELGKEIEEK